MLSSAFPFARQAFIAAFLIVGLLGRAAGQSDDAAQWLVPAGERKAAVADSGEGDARRVILENAFLRAVVDPAHGGRVVSLIHKRTGLELTVPRTETRPGGLLADQLWSQDYAHSDWNNEPFEGKIASSGPDVARIELAREGTLWKGIWIEKSIALAADRAALDVNYRLRVDQGVDTRLLPDLWFHQALAGDGHAFLPAPEGVLKTPQAVEQDNWVYEPTRGWCAFVRDDGIGLAAAMEYQHLRAVRASRDGARTLEWFWRYLQAEPGTDVTSPVHLGVFSGLTSVDAAGASAVVSLDASAGADRGVTARVGIAALADLASTLEVRLVRLSDRKEVAVERRDVKLAADGAGTYDVAFTAGEDGSYLIDASLRGAGPEDILRFEKPVTIGSSTAVYAMAPEAPRRPEAGRRQYIPIDFDFSGLAAETPHVAWARPSALKRLRVLALVPNRHQREAVELAQRVAMDLTTATLTREPLAWEFGDGVYTVKPEHLAAHLDRVAARDYDVIIVGNCWDAIHQSARERLTAMVQAGAGLLITGEPPDGAFTPPKNVGESLGAGAELWDAYLPLHRGSARVIAPLAPARGGAAAAYLGGLPYEVLPPVQIVESALRPLGEDLFAEEPVTLLSAGNYVYAACDNLGKGRVVQLNNDGPLALRGVPDEDAPAFDYWEYHYALLGRLLYYAAGVDLPVRLQRVVCAREEVRIEFASDLKGPAQARVRLRDDFGDTLEEQTVDVTLAPGAPQTVAVAVPAAAGGRYRLADVWIFNDRGTLAWGAGGLRGRPEILERCQPDKESYEPGDTLTLQLGLGDTPPPGGTWRAEARDGYGRVVARAETAVNGRAASLALPLGLACGPALDIRAALEAEGVTLAARTCRATIHRPRDNGKARFFFWGGAGLNDFPSPMVYNLYRRYRDFGMNANWGDKYPEMNGWAFDRLNIAFEVSSVGMRFDGATPEKMQETPDYRGGIGDPGIDATMRALGAERAKPWHRRNILIYGCADENPGPPANSCFCPVCLDAFRKWLSEHVYGGDLAALNATWGTHFAAWSDVMPMTEEEVAKHGAETGRYAAWGDQRIFNDWSYANHARAFVEGIHSVDPGGLVGDSGTREMRPDAARDWAQLAPLYGSIGAYGGTQTAEQDMFNPEMRRYPWNGYNKPNPRTRGAGWVILNGRNYGYGIFVHGSYINPDLTLAQDGRDLQAAQREMQRGVAQLLVGADVAWDPVYVLHSPPAVCASYILRQSIPGETDLYPASQGGLRTLLRDLGVTWRAVSREQVTDGYLTKSGARVLVLTAIDALSDPVADALRAWVEQGGTLIADMQVGRMDDHFTLRERPALDDLFGIDRRAIKVEAAGGANDKEALWDVAPGGGVRVGQADFVETGIAADAKPLWSARRAGQTEPVPIVFRREAGKGRAVYLGFHAFGAYDRVVPQLLSEPAREAEWLAFGQFFNDLFTEAGLPRRPVVRRRDAASGAISARVPYVSVMQKRDGANRYVTVMRDFYCMGHATPDVPARVVFDAPAHIHEMRTGRYLGYGDALDLTLTEYTLGVYALLPYRADGLELKIDGAPAAPGGAVALDARLRAAGAAPGAGWFRVDVVRPDGAPDEAYSGDVRAEQGAARVAWSFALDDPPGDWRVIVRDVATGAQGETVVALAPR